MHSLTTQDWIVVGIGVAAVIVVLAVAWHYATRKRTERLRSHFGPEYERAISDFGDQRKAEENLALRQRRLRDLKLRTLSVAERNRYSEEWWSIQSRFVDDPRKAVMDADRLVTEVLHARGYPTTNFDERIEDLSAAYPHVIGNYRQACDIVAKQSRGGLTTEDMRRAMVLYRNLFDELFRENDDERELRRVS